MIHAIFIFLNMQSRNHLVSSILNHISLLRLLPKSNFKTSTFQPNFLCSSSFKNILRVHSYLEFIHCLFYLRVCNRGVTCMSVSMRDGRGSRTQATFTRVPGRTQGARVPESVRELADEITTTIHTIGLTYGKHKLLESFTDKGIGMV